MSTKPSARTARRADWRRWRDTDPGRGAEARRYEHPIPSRAFLLRYFEIRKIPVSLKTLCADFGLERGKECKAVESRLGAMCREGSLLRNRRGEYCLTKRLSVKTGTVLAHPDGYGFLASDDGDDDVFLPPRTMRSLMHGDRAAVRVQRAPGGRVEGHLVDVLERSRRRLAGEYIQEHGLGFVRPDDPRIQDDVVVAPEDRNGAKPGLMVTVELTAYPDKHSPAVGRIVEVLGSRDRGGMASDLAIRNFELPHEWPEAVLAAAHELPGEVRDADVAGRRDLRELPFVTIDGEDARDFDDALFCRPEGEAFRLYVAIADVSHYVEPGSVLDAEAQRRGTSVYFPDRVLPMLPEKLSNGLCSLNPEVDRLCMVAELSVAAGKVRRGRFYQGVMRSRARLTYTEVAAILVMGDKEARERREELLTHIENLRACYRVLAKARTRRGAIDFDSVETRFVFDAEGRVSELKPVVRTEAHRLVEECMIAANSAVARRLTYARAPALYRVHERPPADKLAELRDFLGLHGLALGGGEHPEPRDYARLLKLVADRPDRLRIETMLLRSLAQAVYAPSPVGHFGLALEDYAHFTSPIRRYPDLVVHRALRRVIARESPEAFALASGELEGLGRHCSTTERRADDATREAADTLKCEFMRERVGEKFAGVVTGVTNFGLFVEIEGLYLEGLVHITALGSDYYAFDSAAQVLRGQRSGTSYAVGDRLEVKVARVSVAERKIDLVPVEPAQSPPGTRPRAKQRRKARKGETKRR